MDIALLKISLDIVEINNVNTLFCKQKYILRFLKFPINVSNSSSNMYEQTKYYLV